jgi:hypothetical protein
MDVRMTFVHASRLFQDVAQEGNLAMCSLQLT